VYVRLVPELPISKTQLAKLGDRLRDAAEIGPEDRDLLAVVLGAYDEALETVKEHLRGLGFQPTDRLKTIGTTVDKLRRDRRSSLRTVQDLAGARVVLAGDLRNQDAAVDAFCERCSGTDLATAVIDRRIDPRAGYRAVHVVVKAGGIPVEVQFRTEFQNMWAQSFERVADRWGRQIRYGGDPTDGTPTADDAGKRRELVAAMIQVSKIVAVYEEAQASVEVREAIAWLERKRSSTPTTDVERVSEERHAMYLAYQASSGPGREGIPTPTCLDVPGC